MARMAEHRVERGVDGDGAVGGDCRAAERRQRPAEERLGAGLEARRVERDLAVVRARVIEVQPPAGERPREPFDVGLRVVGTAVGRGRAEAEQLHQLARVVLVRAALHVVAAVEVHRHRRVERRHLVRQRAEAQPRIGEAQHAVAVGDQPRRRDAVLAADGPVAVPEEGDPLAQRVDRALHAVEPLHDQLVLGGERIDRLVGRAAAGQRRRRRGRERRRRVEQPVDELEVTTARPRGPLRRRRAEARAPEQAVDHRGRELRADVGRLDRRRLGRRRRGHDHRHARADDLRVLAAMPVRVDPQHEVAVTAGLGARVDVAPPLSAGDPATVAEDEVARGLGSARRLPRERDARRPDAFDLQPPRRSQAPCHRAELCHMSAPSTNRNHFR